MQGLGARAHAPITPTFPSSCWDSVEKHTYYRYASPPLFTTITTRGANEWCQKWLVPIQPLTQEVSSPIVINKELGFVAPVRPESGECE